MSLSHIALAINDLIQRESISSSVYPISQRIIGMSHLIFFFSRYSQSFFFEGAYLLM